MPALGSANLQGSATELLASQSGQPAGRSVLPPFSGELSVDEGLKLRNENFKQLIENHFNTHKTLLSKEQGNATFLTFNLLAHLAPKTKLASKCGYFYEGNIVPPITQLRATSSFANPHVLAQFAYKAYEDYKAGETNAQYETRLDLPVGWKLLTTASNITKTNGYFGAAYWHPQKQQVVLAHRGTELKSLRALWTDIQGVVRNKYVRQMESASTFAHEVVEVLREVKRENGVSFQLFFTGHSLGGWLAQVTTFTTEYLKIKENVFLRSNNDKDCYHPHTVVFDSPGCKNMLLKMTGKLDVRHDGRSVDLEHLDITSYLSAPNRINTCNEHLGTVYRIFPDLSDMGWWEKHTPCYNLAIHSMQNIVEAFDTATGQVSKDKAGRLKVHVVVDWPISTGILGGEEYNTFFERAKHFNDYHIEVSNVTFQIEGYHPMRYQTKTYDEGVIRLSVFCQEERRFLESYLWLRQLREFFRPEELFSEIEDSQVQEQAVNILKDFEIEHDKIRCTDASALQALIPYVKRLLQLFPEIKEKTNRALSSDGVRSRVYQIETRRYIERVSQSPLEFNSDSSRFRESLESFGEFLESEQQKVLHLQMADGDEWTGLIKLYQVLQKTGCLSEGQYIVLKLQRLLEINQFMELSTVMQSAVTPHLLLIACEDNQQLDEETKDVIRTICDTIKHKPSIKIVFITRPEGSTVAFLQHMGRRICGEGFVRRVERLTWSDLASSSQEKLLQKSVKFQDATVSLKQLVSVESPVAKRLSLCALLEEKELTIADPVPISNGYNESYYIGRIFRHQVTIKQDILNDKNVKGSHVYLATREQEYKQLCQLNPKSSVHWLQQDKLGKLVWQQSQGSLETVRRYIDTDSSHRYTADDLDKLLEQAEHQRVMLISDTAGMGKSTVLTYLSKQIKQKFPTKWVVRIDLNDHTDALKVLKEEQINKEKAIEFVSQKLLKLKPGLEKELFKKCCEEKQKVRIVIMLDGFDEISPFYKETVIDLLQALRQTAVEQLWVTTRLHLREELEDELQQLSYTLEHFAKDNQVEFLTKFWSLKDWFTEPNDKWEGKEKSKLEIYAEHLVDELAKSISDKDRELTGIPLQTRMLAEAFDEEVRTFCESAESMPELPSKLDLLGLYERFIERKYDIYQDEKSKVSVNNVAAKEQRKHHLKSITEELHLLAMKVLFTEEQVVLFENDKERSFSAEVLTRIGIVQVSHDGKPHFIHRTFAEFYVADCLVNRLTEGNKTSEQVATFILKDIFLDNAYEMIRVFVDGLLSRSKISNVVLKQYGNRIHDLREYGDKILQRSAFEGNVNIIGLLLDSVLAGDHRDTINEMLLGRDKKGLTAWNIAVLSNNTQVLEKVWECAEKKLTEEEIKYKLLLAGVLKEYNYLDRRTWSTEFSWSIEKYYGPQRTAYDYCLDNGSTNWHLAAILHNVQVVQKLWEWAKQKLTAQEINNKVLLARDKEGRTLWHEYAPFTKLEKIKEVWEWEIEKLTTEEIKNRLLDTGKGGRTVWHVAAKWGKLEILQKVWEWAEKKLTAEEVKNKLLLATDKEGSTALHLAAECGNLEILQKVWEWAEKKLTAEEVKNKLLLGTDKEGRTVWHVAARWSRSEILQKVWEWAEEKLTAEEVKNKLLLGTDNAGRTAWHVAAECGNLEILQKVWEWAEEKLTAEEVKNKLLLGTDKEGRTVWHVAARWSWSELLQKVWEWAEDYLTTEELNKLLVATDKEGKAVCHMATQWGKLETLQ